MADDGDKTEEPSPRRLQEARRKGQVALSRDFSGGVAFAVVVATLVGGGASLIGGLTVHLATSLTRAVASPSPLSAAAAGVALGQGLFELIASLALPLGAAFGAAVAIGVVQTGGLFSFEPLRLDLSRLQPSLERVVSKRALLELVKGFVKIAVATAIAWSVLRPVIRALAALPGVEAGGILQVVGSLLGTVGFRLALAAVAIGGADFLYQRWQHLKGLRMSHEEVKREYKDQEGDPHHKAERQRLHRELLEQRMVSEVRKADFVVVNPDHIAVALKYDRDADAAPVVVAVGERLLAERIKEVAREAGVPIFRDVALARSLRDVAEGDEIPIELYEAVAEILRVVDGIGAPPALGAAAPGDGAGQGAREEREAQEEQGEHAEPSGRGEDAAAASPSSARGAAPEPGARGPGGWWRA